MVWLAIALVSLVTLSNAFFVVDERERAVILQLGEFQGTDFQPGLHVKIPFIQDVRKFDRRLLMLDSDTESFLTSEKKNVQVDYYVKWRIDNAAAYYRATGGQSLVAADRLSSIVNRGMRDQFGSLTIQQAVSGERDQITKAVMESAGENIRDLGIELKDVRVKRIDLPTEVSESVYDRMRAERKRVASDLRARGAEEGERIRADVDREAQVVLAQAYKEAETLRGEGDAKATEVYAQAYGRDTEFYRFYRSLNIYRDSFSSGDDMLVLEPKGEFFRYFNPSR
ncbi:protease modulator HflC [Flagellatimonas centrodinii]|uniref:protease modulator HflC n=1 Tax=Flagellatimonas centrodinii TaxID=2806210 RepID=UPI001FEF7723|nr:protease modulator HflC [Flagellatimonas centrodinii]ULQ45751.1 protease modulator HflC [Flagellatimonas centrodinii]